MAGPRAPIGSLSQHSDKAAQLARKPANASAARAAATKTQARKKTDDSDSGSSSGDSDSDSDTETKPSSNWAESLKSKTPTKATINGISPSQPASAQKKVGKKTSGSDTDSSSGSGSDSNSDSDSDSDADSDKMTKANAKATTKTKVNTKVETKVATDSSSEGESESEEDESDGSSDSDDEIKPKAKTATAPTKAKPAAVKASSDESGSESSDDESDSGAKVTNIQEDSSSEEESDSDSESDSEGEPETTKTTKTTKAAVQKPAVKAKPAEPDSSSEDGSEDDARDSSEEDSDSDSEEDQSKAVAKRNGKSTVSNVPEVFAPGFQVRKAGAEVDATQVARLFRDAKAEGKQIWYFTAPASLPIEVIQEQAIPLDALQAGKPILSHDGKEFGGTADADVANSITVMIPNKAGEHYGRSKIAVDRTIHIKRVMRFNQDGTQQESITSTGTVITKGPRPQPKGMKIRYQPLGVTNVLPGHMGPGNDAESDEDVEMSQAPPLSTATPKVSAKKRKHGVVEDGTPSKESAEASSTKRSKKIRITETPGVASTQKKPAKQTPIAPPTIPALNGGSSKLNQQVASSPVLSTRKKTTSAQDLPSTQPTKANGSKPKRITPILPPAIRAGIAISKTAAPSTPNRLGSKIFKVATSGPSDLSFKAFKAGTSSSSGLFSGVSKVAPSSSPRLFSGVGQSPKSEAQPKKIIRETPVRIPHVFGMPRHTSVPPFGANSSPLSTKRARTPVPFKRDSTPTPSKRVKVERNGLKTSVDPFAFDPTPATLPETNPAFPPETKPFFPPKTKPVLPPENKYKTAPTFSVDKQSKATAAAGAETKALGKKKNRKHKAKSDA